VCVGTLFYTKTQIIFVLAYIQEPMSFSVSSVKTFNFCVFKKPVTPNFTTVLGNLFIEN
jgi:hypothetical protein